MKFGEKYFHLKSKAVYISSAKMGTGWSWLVLVTSMHNNVRGVKDTVRQRCSQPG